MENLQTTHALLDPVKHTKTTSIAEIFIKYVEKMEVPFVFGIPGGFIAPFLKLLRKSKKIAYIMGRQETGTVFMADGYSRVTGKAGIVLVTSGPGALNALTGIACAQKGYSSVMLISGQTPVTHFGMGALQEATSEGVNIVEIFKHACAASDLVFSSKMFRNCLLKASRLCLGIPRHAVHLSIPLDISTAKIEEIEFPAAKEAYVLPAITTDSEQINRVFHDLIRTKNPLILLGSGCREALRNYPERLAGLEKFCATFAIPVVTSLQAKGIFPENHPKSLGVYGFCGSEQADAFLQEPPDILLVIGSSLGETTTNSWNQRILPSHAMIQIDINPKHIGRAFPVRQAIVADAGVSIDKLVDCHASRQDDSRESAALYGIRT